MSDLSSSSLRVDPASAAAYVASLAAELRRLARGNGLTTLAYLLEMAELEAKSVAADLEASGSLSPPRGGRRPG
ncbi:hypothetical protein V5F49_04150 [Xanthobacter sp. V3C-3]|uniref:hypothetical protein n=1 Tax=Xanthobacter lutulentifluminis TaxID=3119935 RepID=UPI00372A066C